MRWARQASPPTIERPLAPPPTGRRANRCEASGRSRPTVLSYSQWKRPPSPDRESPLLGRAPAALTDVAVPNLCIGTDAGTNRDDAEEDGFRIRPDPVVSQTRSPRAHVSTPTQIQPRRRDLAPAMSSPIRQQGSRKRVCACARPHEGRARLGRRTCPATRQ